MCIWKRSLTPHPAHQGTTLVDPWGRTLDERDGPRAVMGTVPAQQSVFQEKQVCFRDQSEENGNPSRGLRWQRKQEGLPERLSQPLMRAHIKRSLKWGPVTPPLAHLPWGWCEPGFCLFVFHESTLGLGGSIMRRVLFSQLLFIVRAGPHDLNQVLIEWWSTLATELRWHQPASGMCLRPLHPCAHFNSIKGCLSIFST